MKWGQVKRNWSSIRDEVRLKWGKFTDDDLAKISGNRESFVRLLKQRYEVKQLDAEFKVDAFVEGLNPMPKLTKQHSWPQHCLASLRSYIPAQPHS